MTAVSDVVRHLWAKRELTADLPPTADTSRASWDRWQVGLTEQITRPANLPLRVLLVLGNLAGHRTPAFDMWLFAYGATAALLLSTWEANRNQREPAPAVPGASLPGEL